MILYLLLADLQNTALSALLIFSERVLYPTYAAGPRLWNLSVLDDQAAAGVLMWVPGSVIFLVPVGVLVMRFLDAPRIRRAACGGAALLLMGAWPAWGHHGGEVRLMEKAGPFVITVFSDPTPLRVGPVDLSVLVQDRDSGRPILRRRGNHAAMGARRRRPSDSYPGDAAERDEQAVVCRTGRSASRRSLGLVLSW
jgi:hypothetical protein